MNLRQVAAWLSTLALAAGSLTCSSDISDPDPQPAALVMAGGNGQVGLVSQPLAEPLVVVVEDQEGQPLAGVTVSWSVGGGGSVDPAQVASGADGRVAVQRVLGDVAGVVTTTASVGDLPAVVFTSTAAHGGLPLLIIATQPSAAAVNAVALDRQPVIQVEDGNDQPVGAGVAVTASVAGASLTGTTQLETDAAGIVRFTDLTLSGDDGSYTMTFSASGYLPAESGPIALSATPSDDDRLVITTQPSSDAENGEVLAQQPVLRAETAGGDPLGAGIEVTASLAGATLSGTAIVQTDANGVATFTDLALSGPSGSYNLDFSAPGLTGIQSAAITLQTTANEMGQWTAPVDWPIVAIHTMLLPDGRVLAINRFNAPQIWDPANGTFKPVPAPANLFCAGHALLPDGQVFLAGGHISDNHGLPNITLFSATTEAWTSLPAMPKGRWYPTTTVMGNGDVVILAGKDQGANEVPIPDLWSNGTLRSLTGAPQPLPYYPRAFLTPDGRVYVAGPTKPTRYLTTSGNGSWSNGPTRVGEARQYGSAVMYDDGKILYAGGNQPPAPVTNTAEIIDLNQASPSWSFTGSMAHGRRHLNLTVLPNGEVLATSGVGGNVFNDTNLGVHAAEMWNPETGQWRTMASSAITRGYHSSSLLLPDGRVLHAGSGEGAGAPNQLNAEFFSPPYLLRGSRPEITSAPADVAYGAAFRVLTPQASSIARVSLIRLGAVTHAFDENQRFQWLSYTADATGLDVTAPSSANRAPPGHYMVFILDGDDVPSVGHIIRIH
ncbi:MAG: galactose oxidase-like domain-containing protein [Gemmatimonadales bacterium]